MAVATPAIFPVPTVAARAVIRDVGRALNIPLPEVDAIAKKIPGGPGVKLGESLKADKGLSAMGEKDPRIAELFEIAGEVVDKAVVIVDYED
jgi:DNA polymerase-3 subunit alpha